MRGQGADQIAVMREWASRCPACKSPNLTEPEVGTLNGQPDPAVQVRRCLDCSAVIMIVGPVA
jgi:hypothetical protein